MRAPSSSSSTSEVNYADGSIDADAASGRANWIGVISVLGYCAICGLVYLLH